MGADLPRARILFQETKALLERGLAVGGHVDDKAANLVTFNALLLGLLATAFKVAAPAKPPAWFLAALLPGPFLLLFSTLSAIRAYRPIEYAVGLSSLGIETALLHPTKEVDLLASAAHAYLQASDLNASRLQRRAVWVQRSVLLLAAGLAFSMGSVAFIIFLGPWGAP